MTKQIDFKVFLLLLCQKKGIISTVKDHSMSWTVYTVPVHFSTAVHYSIYGTSLLHLDKVTAIKREAKTIYSIWFVETSEKVTATT